MDPRNHKRFKRPISLLTGALVPQEPLRRKPLKVDFGAIPDLSVLQRLRIQVFGNLFLRWVKPEGYSGAIPVYIIKCSHHGLYLDTPHGNRKYFQCRNCLNEVIEEERQRIRIGKG